jgi:macrocin-O-methyltransferase TylF-like protien
VWVADSFEGLPKPNESKYPADKSDVFHTYDELKVSIDDVKNNFSKYNLLDGQVKFLKGWFSDTLPKASINKLSVLRLDGDMYESTMDALVNLYPKLSVGGYIIIDDYSWVEACKKAVTDYRRGHSIDEEIVEIDWTAVYWQKLK